MSTSSDILFTEAVSELNVRVGRAETGWHQHTASKQGARGECTQRSRDMIYCRQYTTGSVYSSACFPPSSQTRWILRKDPLTKFLPKPVGSRAENNVAHWEEPSGFCSLSSSALKTLSGYIGAVRLSSTFPSASFRAYLGWVTSWFCHNQRERLVHDAEADWETNSEPSSFWRQWESLKKI